jgi:2-methylisocitrate lyase-like PEP mutase family enzyme
MADVVRIGSGVPRVPLRRADDLVDRIEALKDEATARGFGTLAYFLDTALIEARLQEQHIIDDTAIARAEPDELWRPVEDRD